jgi:hypothetical protein
VEKLSNAWSRRLQSGRLQTQNHGDKERVDCRIPDIRIMAWLFGLLTQDKPLKLNGFHLTRRELGGYDGWVNEKEGGSVELHLVRGLATTNSRLKASLIRNSLERWN